jgi:Na+/melibiose symporter-like transporter
MSDAMQTVKKHVPWLYFIAMLFQVLGGTIVGTYLAFYITDRMLITAVVMGALLLVQNVGNLILGLASGIIIQKFRPRLGQYRHWLLYGPIILVVGAIMCFINPDIPMMAKAVIVFVGYILYGGALSFIQLSQNGMLAKIAGPNMTVRMQIAGKIVQGQNAGTIIASAITLPLILMFDKMGVNGYLVAQVIFGVLSLAGQMCLFIGTKEYEKYEPPAENAPDLPRVSVVSLIFGSLKNPQMIILLLADTLRFTATMSIMRLAMYYYSYVAKNPGLMTGALTVQSVLGLAMAFILAPAARKLGKKNSALVTGIITTAAYFGLSFFAFGRLWAYMAFTWIAYASQVLINSCGINLYLDCGEYQLYSSGKDNRTFVMSLYGIGIKIGLMLGSVIIAFILSQAGYNAANTAEPLANPSRFVFILGLIVGILNGAYTLLMCIYGITEEKSKFYVEENHKQASAAAVASTA